MDSEYMETPEYYNVFADVNGVLELRGIFEGTRDEVLMDPLFLAKFNGRGVRFSGHNIFLTDLVSGTKKDSKNLMQIQRI